MAHITAALIKELQQRTGAGIKDCEQALLEADGNLDLAAAALMSAVAGEAKAAAASFYTNQFLVAMPGLEDENFSHTVTLLCEHNDKGALGLVINRPTDLSLRDMLDHMELAHGQLSGNPIVHWGGPVQPERGFVVHSTPGGWESSLQISDGLFITTSRDVLTAIGQGKGPREFFVALGYAGWTAGQLEGEILHNSWLNTPADRAILFTMPAEERWQAATRLLGVDVIQLTGQAGHA
jgi:putative transcriptional regulator